MEKILVISAHPDDFEIGLGGTIAKLSAQGHDILSIVATIPYSEKVRKAESKKSAEILGTKIKFLDLKPDKVIFNRKLIGIIDELITDFKPSNIAKQN